MKYWALFTFIFCVNANIFSQSSDCNHLGVWLWHLEYTGFESHSLLAKKLKDFGIKRIYVKASDGTADPTYWPEMLDKNLVQDYKEEGIEVWAWSYNYKYNNDAQAQALYYCAQSGYDGYVVDVEAEFDGDSTNLAQLFKSFYNKKNQAKSDGYINEDFSIYCTTWGNPIDHLFYIDAIDPWVDGYMPQTYVEVWGNTYLQNIPYYVQLTKDEYIYLGATKPVHPMCASQEGIITAEQINEFIANAGPETSLWRVPGGGVPIGVWNDWAEVDWDMNFCTKNQNEDDIAIVEIYPNPTNGYIQLTIQNSIQSVSIVDAMGNVMRNIAYDQLTSNSWQISLSNLSSGLYYSVIQTTEEKIVEKIIKL